MTKSRRSAVTGKLETLGEFKASANTRRAQTAKDAARGGTVSSERGSGGTMIGLAGIVSDVIAVKAAGTFAEPIEVDAALLARVVNEQHAILVLGAAMAAAPEPVSPELVRSLQAEENWWRKIEQELPSLSSTETAELMGAKPTNRNFASTQRASGRLLGYTRRHAIRYPRFQFDDRGRVRAVIPQLIAIARGFGIPDEDLVMWLASPTTFFASQDRPVDHLDDPERLLAAARDDFGAAW
jgi:hypothetical protein